MSSFSLSEVAWVCTGGLCEGSEPQSFCHLVLKNETAKIRRRTFRFGSPASSQRAIQKIAEHHWPFRRRCRDSRRGCQRPRRTLIMRFHPGHFLESDAWGKQRQAGVQIPSRVGGARELVKVGWHSELLLIRGGSKDAMDGCHVVCPNLPQFSVGGTSPPLGFHQRDLCQIVCQIRKTLSVKYACFTAFLPQIREAPRLHESSGESPDDSFCLSVSQSDEQQGFASTPTSSLCCRSMTGKVSVCPSKSPGMLTMC